jgi:hypothetical protein
MNQTSPCRLTQNICNLGTKVAVSTTEKHTMFCVSDQAIENQLSSISTLPSVKGNGSRLSALQGDDEESELYEYQNVEIGEEYDCFFEEQRDQQSVTRDGENHYARFEDDIAQFKVDTESQLETLQEEFYYLKEQLIKTQEITQDLADQLEAMKIEKTERSETERVLTDKIVMMASSLQEVCFDKTQAEVRLKFEVSRISQERDELRAKLTIVEGSLKNEMDQITQKRDLVRAQLGQSEFAYSNAKDIESKEADQARDNDFSLKILELEQQIATERIRSADYKRQLAMEANNAAKWNGLVKELTIKLLDLSGTFSVESTKHTGDAQPSEEASASSKQAPSITA